MKSNLLTLAGTLALVAVLGKFYAIPAVAQVTRAALVQDRDSPGGRRRLRPRYPSMEI